jgi:LmbE family N-acetylglucosaminyl deacetylase
MNLLVFFAHPDDETMLAGGTLALLQAQGARIHYLCATRGEGGETGTPPICSREELGAVRSQELASAVAALGGGRLDFLPYTDPLVGEGDTLYAYTDRTEELVDSLAGMLLAEKPDAVLTHGSSGEYGHPAHLLCHTAMLAAFEKLPAVKPLLYTFQAAFENHPKPRTMNKKDEAHLVLDISLVMEKKLAATMCHRTQHALFVRRPSLAAGRTLSIPETMIGVESLHRVYPTVEGNIIDPLADLLRQSGLVL